jgi:lauroyl/myristoyl acyltransferase
MSQSLVSYYAYRVMGSVAPLLPPRLGYWLASNIGRLIFYLYPRGVRTVRQNLYHVLGADADDARVKATAQGVFRNLSKNYYDLFQRHTLTDEEIRASVTIEGLDHLEMALAGGKGAVVTTGHFGPFDAVAQAASSLNLKVTAPAEHLKPEKLYQYVCRLRSSNWITLLPVDGPLVGLFRALHRGEIVAVAADRDITSSGIVVDFFGVPARLPDGHVQLAMRTGARMVPCFGLRKADNSCLLYIEPALEMEDGDDFETSVRVNVERVLARLEEWIGRYPEQWIMLHPIWGDLQRLKGQPHGQGGPAHS